MLFKFIVTKYIFISKTVIAFVHNILCMLTITVILFVLPNYHNLGIKYAPSCLYLIGVTNYKLSVCVSDRKAESIAINYAGLKSELSSNLKIERIRERI